MKGFFSAFNHKTLYLTIPITCRKNLNQKDLADCKIITIEGEAKLFWWSAQIIVTTLKFYRN
jgi:hypothetical protein